MTTAHINRNFWILILILFTGLGLALALPTLAQAQQAGKGDQLSVISNQLSVIRELSLFTDHRLVEDESNALAAASVYRVAKSGDGTDGLTWTKAFTNVQSALVAADSGVEIWVATGIYTPGTALTNTFTLTSGVELYGGFAATETLRTQRDWAANPTVLSGDIAGDDTTDANGVVTTTANISGTNSYHVVTGSGVATTTVLDGFTITAGQADGSYASPCDNECGGGMYNLSGSPTLANVTFSGNLADNDGSGMYNYDFSSPLLTDVTFSGNFATRGGGMYNELSNPSLTDVTFSSNSAEYYGGGMFNDKSSPTLTNVTFSGNSAAYIGGGMCNIDSNPTLTNVTFSGNLAGSGGGMWNDSNSSPVLTNVTFSGNSVEYHGGGMYNSSSSPILYNSILWNNRDSSGTGTITATIALDSSSSITLTHSLAQGTGGSTSWTADASFVNGGENLDDDPLFTTPISLTNVPTTSGNLRLGAGSPAINAGENQYVTGVSTDLDGEPRINGGTVDMGAYEFPFYTLAVSLAGSGDGSVTGSGISCAGDCTESYPDGTVVTLTAAAGTGSTFAGWSGACTDLTGDCVVTMTEARSVTATFTQQHTLSVSLAGTGGGGVTSSPAGIDCSQAVGSDCSETYDHDTVVTLTAVADSGSIFAGWSGACSGSGTCQVTMTEARAVTATCNKTDIYLPLVSR